MKYAFVAAALVAVVSGQTLADIPTCALPCIDDAISSETDCTTTDFDCICKDSNFSAIQGAATSCVIDKCGADTALNEVLPATEALCSSQGGDGGETTTSETEPEPTTSEESEPTTAAETTAVETTTAAVTTTTAVVVTPSTTPTVTPTVVVPTNGTVPTTSTVPTGAAAAFGPVGGVALLGLAALAL